MTIKEKARLQRGYKNFLRRLYSKQVKKTRARIICEENARANNKYGKHVSIELLLTKSLSSSVIYLLECENSELNKALISHPLKTIFQHKACTDKLYADSFYKVQKNSHSSFEVICCRS